MTRQPYIPRLETTFNGDSDKLFTTIEREVKKEISPELIISRGGMKIVYWGDSKLNYYRTAFKQFMGRTRYVKTVEIPASTVLDILSLDNTD